MILTVDIVVAVPDVDVVVVVIIVVVVVVIVVAVAVNVGDEARGQGERADDKVEKRQGRDGTRTVTILSTSSLFLLVENDKFSS